MPILAPAVRLKTLATLFGRVALGSAFLSAVASRFGLWNGSVDVSHFAAFVEYTAEVNAFMPAPAIPFLAWAATAAELSLGVALIIGFKTQYVALASAFLLGIFGSAMAVSLGPKSPLDYSVFSASSAALLLAVTDARVVGRNDTRKERVAMKMASTGVRDHIVRTAHTDWKPLVERGVDTTGISVKCLRVEPATGRAPSFLLRFEPGAKYPYHDHPAGEELLVLSGSCVIEGTTLEEGDYLYTPPGAKHSVRSETGCTVLFQVPEEVVIL